MAISDLWWKFIEENIGVYMYQRMFVCEAKENNQI